MSLVISSVIFIGVFLVLLLTGVYIAVAMGVAGVLSLEWLEHQGGIIGAHLFNCLESWVFLAIPLFLFMGEIVRRGGLGNRLYQGTSQWTRVIPGGLIHSNIISCSLFAAISGSGVATAATIGTIAYPEEIKRGYARSLITGSLAAGGTLGILIPPSINMIVYGGMTGVPVGQLFIAGIIPGILLSLLFMVYIAIAAKVNSSLTPAAERISWRYFPEGIKALKDVMPVVLLMVFIMGSIYGGIMTPTEAAAVSSTAAVVLCILFGKMNLTVIREAAESTMKTSGMILFLILAAYLMAIAISMMRLPQQLTVLVGESGLGPYAAWFLAVFITITLGCFINGIAIMLFTLPVFWPILIVGFGFDPIMFGIFMVLQAECAQVTPPVGINLFIIHGITGEKDIGPVIKGVMPFFILMIVVIVVITFFPQLTTFLPNKMSGR